MFLGSAYKARRRVRQAPTKLKMCLGGSMVSAMLQSRCKSALLCRFKQVVGALEVKGT